MVEDTGKCGGLALVHPDVLFEAEAVLVGEEEGFAEEQGCAGEHGRVVGAVHLLFELIEEFGVLDEAFAGRLEGVVEKDGHGLALEDGGAGSVHFVAGEVIVVVGDVVGDFVGGLVAPLFEVGVLVLEGVGELMDEDGLLGFGIEPVEEVDGAGFGVVVASDLLFEEGEHEGLEVEVLVEEAEFLEDDFAALHAFGVFIFVELVVEVLFDGGAAGEGALDLLLEGQAGFVGGVTG